MHHMPYSRLPLTSLVPVHCMIYKFRCNHSLTDTLKFPDFKQKFKEIQRQYSPEPRPYYVYLTSVTVRVRLSSIIPFLSGVRSVFLKFSPSALSRVHFHCNLLFILSLRMIFRFCSI